LLRDFNDEVFLQSHNTDLLVEYDRLAEMDRETKEAWDKMIEHVDENTEKKRSLEETRLEA
jgi:hypothetical protein